MEQRAGRWQGCGGNNHATLAELLVTFFTHFRAVEPLWRHGLVASTYAGRWVAGSSWAPGRYCLGVEDPFAAGDNVVGPGGCCSTRHPTHFGPSFVGFTGTS